MTTFGHQIKELRKKHNMTQRELARIIDISFTYVSKIENDKLDAPPSENLIRQLAELFDSDPQILLDLAGKVDTKRLQQIAMDTPQAGTVLRRIQERNISQEQWQKINRILDEEE